MAKAPRNNRRGGRRRNARRQPATIAQVVQRLRRAFAVSGQTLRKRIYNNPHGFTADQILVALGPDQAAKVQQQLATADALATSLAVVQPAVTPSTPTTTTA